MRIPNPLCWLSHLWFSLVGMLRAGHPISGHDFIETAVHDVCRVQVLTCKRCGQVSIGWSIEGRQ